MGDGPWREGARAHESHHQAMQGGGYSVQEKESHEMAWGSGWFQRKKR
jgi:hypothetical protein